MRLDGHCSAAANTRVTNTYHSVQMFLERLTIATEKLAPAQPSGTGSAERTDTTTGTDALQHEAAHVAHVANVQ